MDQAVKTTIYQRLIALYYWYSMRHSLQTAGKAKPTNITSLGFVLSSRASHCNNRVSADICFESISGKVLKLTS